MPLSAFQVLFKYFSRQIYFSRTFQDSPIYSSTFQACANLGRLGKELEAEILFFHSQEAAFFIKVIIMCANIKTNVDFSMFSLHTKPIRRSTTRTQIRR